jgi:biopolymer transport protein ExbD
VSNPNIIKRDNIQLAIDAAGIVFWNGEAVDRIELTRRLKANAAFDPQPELHIHADGITPYRRVAEVLSDAAKSGMTRIGFVTDPSAPGSQ